MSSAENGTRSMRSRQQRQIRITTTATVVLLLLFGTPSLPPSSAFTFFSKVPKQRSYYSPLIRNEPATTTAIIPSSTTTKTALYAFDPSPGDDAVKTPSSSSTSVGINGASADNPSSSSGGLISMNDAKSQLFSSFAALDLPDQYDAVLTGLCAKILDNDIRDNQCIAALQDPVQLLQEMNQKRIQASPRSLSALVDSTILSQDAKTMSRVLSLAMKNRGIRSYGSLQADVTPLPTNPTSRVKCPDGKTRTRQERLDEAPSVPTDDRAKEITSALGFSAVVFACLFTDLFHYDDITPFTNLLLIGIFTVGALDNFYDLIKTATSFLSKQVNKNKIGDDSGTKSFQLPDKESLPFGLGTGQLSGSIVRGLTRLLTVDAERESQCEAAALYTAYALGLPCFAFRPNAFESSVLVVESTRNDNELDSFDSSSGIMRILVWLLSPVVMENMKHSQLIMSDPREAYGFLDRLEDVVQKSGGSNVLDGSTSWWMDDEKERNDLVQWAYLEADLLVRENRRVIDEISQSLTSGSATVGDCVAIIERW